MPVLEAVLLVPPEAVPYPPPVANTRAPEEFPEDVLPKYDDPPFPPLV